MLISPTTTPPTTHSPNTGAASNSPRPSAPEPAAAVPATSPAAIPANRQPPVRRMTSGGRATDPAEPAPAAWLLARASIAASSTPDGIQARITSSRTATVGSCLYQTTDTNTLPARPGCGKYLTQVCAPASGRQAGRRPG